MYIILDKNKNIPDGFRNLTDEEIAKDFLKLDVDKNYFISKNEWIISLVKLLESELPELDKEAPDAIMKRIQELSDEFDKYDLDKNKYIDYIEYNNFLKSNILISE
ncbi:hypothetical protein IJ541_02780 [bacterium]|nr:hypothetical protein [bacterium]